MALKTEEAPANMTNVILTAAEAVFLEKGVTLTTDDNIADRAGISREKLHEYYADKIAVCIAICERAMKLSMHITVRVPDESPLDSLRRMGMMYASTFHIPSPTKNALEIIYFKCENTDEFSSIQKFRQVWDKRTIRVTETLVNKAILAGDLPRSLDLNLVTIFLLSLLEGVTFQLICKDQLDPERWPKIQKVLNAGIDSIRFSTTLHK